MNKTNRNIISSFDNLTTDEILDTCYKNAYLYDVMALNVHGDMNIGNMIRTKEYVGMNNSEIISYILELKQKGAIVWQLFHIY
jgi:hypothetical protein